MAGIKNRLREYKVVKLMSVATLPLALSYDLAYATSLKLKSIPSLLLPRLSLSKVITPHLNALQEALIPLP